jgi:predicted O-methyltransferase YrrM
MFPRALFEKVNIVTFENTERSSREINELFQKRRSRLRSTRQDKTNMLYQIKSYFKFLLRSTNQHGVHSPFVFDLVTKWFYNKKNHASYAKLKNYRSQLLHNNETIEVTDFGAGSRIFKSDTRAISAIAKTAGIPKKRQQLLFRLAHYLKPKNSLELGTSLGLGTIAMALGNSEGFVDTIEGCPNTAGVASDMLKKFTIENYKLHQADFESFFTSENCKEAYDLVFIDGNHTKKQTLAYFNILRKKAHNETVLIFDDIYWSHEMTEAWEEIKAHPKVQVSIDTFYWGLIFFRSEQQKEHFTIRL